MDYVKMTIPELEAEIVNNQSHQLKLKATQLEIHNVCEAKRKALPVAGGVGQVMLPNGMNVLAMLNSLPAAERASIVDQINKSK